jgi:hypothetical protein
MSGRPPTRRTTTRKVRFGARDFLARGLERNFWGDLYHTSLTISWLQFFAFAALAFLTINTVYAALYFLGHEPIANARPGSFRDLFYFSIETLATVGYGDMHPQTDYAHLLATVEIFTGLSFLAIMTGLVFTRFSRPRARVLFADHALITEHDRRKVWTVRIANVRLNPGDAGIRHVQELCRAAASARRKSALCLKLEFVSRYRRSQSAKRTDPGGSCRGRRASSSRCAAMMKASRKT